MSGKEFFVSRYRELGWEYRPMVLKQAIRINTMNAKMHKVIERLEHRGAKLEKISFLESGYWVCDSRFSVGATSEYLLGLYSIQEPAAQIPATLFADLKDRTVLDACAAPGGKTVQLADLMRNAGTIDALDIRNRRLAALANQLERCHVHNAIVFQMDARGASRLGLKFDCILLDVPCSGNHATDKDWFRRRSIEDIQSKVLLQREILSEAARIVKKNGEIVYSTCSLEPEEDEMNIDWAIRNLGLRTERLKCYGEEGLRHVFGIELDSSIRNCRRMWPGQTQGFFICKLRK